ncbi:hypothetical protein AAFF_G00170870 [Aldrovandia affinis]|uniref:Uncharacterized protein n=1 Tax=Aldrovandia affinis TaxID=143900 RepID=A0AAD7W788_9TELE|nr:hypothetical protein AAFF_G00170870 [Aldrovandia affinis]
MARPQFIKRLWISTPTLRRFMNLDSGLCTTSQAHLLRCKSHLEFQHISIGSGWNFSNAGNSRERFGLSCLLKIYSFLLDKGCRSLTKFQKCVYYDCVCLRSIQVWSGWKNVFNANLCHILISHILFQRQRSFWFILLPSNRMNLMG